MIKLRNSYKTLSENPRYQDSVLDGVIRTSRLVLASSPVCLFGEAFEAKKGVGGAFYFGAKLRTRKSQEDPHSKGSDIGIVTYGTYPLPTKHNIKIMRPKNMLRTG